MIPFSDIPEQRRRHFPVIMLLLIAANVLMFLYELSLGPAVVWFIEAYGAMPLQISTGQNLVPGSPSPTFLTLLTSMFLHGGFLHLAGNMLFLWVFGDNVEDALGHLPFLGFFLLCGVAAGLAQVYVDPASRTPAIGASGAIAGVLAAYLVLFPRAVVRTLLVIGPFITVTRVSAFLMIGVWILFQFVSGLVELSGTAGGSSVAFWAHIGGFLVGLVVAAAWKSVRGSSTSASE